MEDEMIQILKLIKVLGAETTPEKIEFQNKKIVFLFPGSIFPGFEKPELCL
jgi:hypothetical protein